MSKIVYPAQRLRSGPRSDHGSSRQGAGHLVGADRRIRAEGFVRAIIEAMQFIRVRRDDGIKILSRYTRMSDMKVLAQTYDYHSRMIWPRVPEIQPEDLKLVLEELAEPIRRRARSIPPS
jgi:hypothetical protein